MQIEARGRFFVDDSNATKRETSNQSSIAVRVCSEITATTPCGTYDV